jgi:hypothetical protein
MLLTRSETVEVVISDQWSVVGAGELLAEGQRLFTDH